MLAGFPLFTGPQDPSQIISYLNTLVPLLNAGAGGLYSARTAPASTTAVTTEETLQTIAVPAALQANVGQIIQIDAAGTFGANGNNKTVKLKFGAIEGSSGVIAANATPWRFRLTVAFLTNATQYYWWEFVRNGIAAVVGQGSGTVDTAAAVTASVTGTNGTAAAADIVCSYMAVSQLR